MDLTRNYHLGMSSWADIQVGHTLIREVAERDKMFEINWEEMQDDRVKIDIRDYKYNLGWKMKGCSEVDRGDLINELPPLGEQ